jgi:hypothetical protein
LDPFGPKDQLGKADGRAQALAAVDEQMRYMIESMK